MKWLSLTHSWQHATSFQQPPETNGPLFWGVSEPLCFFAVCSPVETCLLSQYWRGVLLLPWHAATSFSFSVTPLSHFVSSHTPTHTHIKGEICPDATVLQCWLAASERGMPGISPTPQIGLQQGNQNPFSFSITSLKQCPPYSPVPSRDSVRWLILLLLILQYTMKSMERSICCNKKE